MPSIAGQSILILGGTSGMGFAVAKVCLESNCRVTIASSTQTKVDQAMARLIDAVPQAKYRPSGHTIDLSNDDVETDLEGLFTKVTKYGAEPLDHIISTAGKPDFTPFDLIGLQFLAKTAQLPVFVPLLIAKVAPKYLRPGYSSSITFTSGQVAEKPQPGMAVLVACATAVHGLTRSLAIDLAPRRVNCVSPGSTETELWGKEADMLRKKATERSLLGKAGSPEEVAEAYLYLLRNKDATGSIVSTNGDLTLK